MRAVCFAITALVIFYQCSSQEILHGPGVMAPAEPRQQRLANAEPFEWQGYRVQPLATFDIEARVLSKERYRIGREAELAPVDLALGWGPMSDESVLKDIRISQSGRFYHWSTNDPPIPTWQIGRHSANMHLIPADASVEAALHDVKRGHVVRFTGDLVKAEHPDGFRWKSSLTRRDAGGGACEVVFVRRIEVFDPSARS